MTRRTLLIGSPRDPTFVHFLKSLADLGSDPVVVDVDRFCAAGTVEGELAAGGSLVLRDGPEVLRLEDFSSCYARFIALPPGASESAASAMRFRALQLAVSALSILVVNRPSSGGSNNSKPYQTALLQEFGFSVPRGLSTNDPDSPAAFLSACTDGAIFKSNSGTRSIVQPVREADSDRLPSLVNGPAYFQERIWGDDVRVHVVRDRCFCVRIRSSDVDYRYGTAGDVSESPCDIPAAIERRCAQITAALNLEFSGIDLVHCARSGEYFALEVNPMPGYHGYDITLRGEISKSLAALLRLR